MKYNITIFILVIAFSFFSCDFRKSVSKDLNTGLTTNGDGLSCDNVYLSNGEQKLNGSSFTYGEKVYVNFENVEGFEKIGDNAFPGLQILVVSQEGDTVLQHDDLYAKYEDGINISPLLVQANITVADPMHSNKNYTLHVNIWDKKGKGTYKAKMDFNIVPNDQIKVESNGVSYNEIYLFSLERKATIIDNKAKFNENIYVIFEGLEGFKNEAGKTFIGLSKKVTDADGKVILNEEDLLGDSWMEATEIKSQLAPNFTLTNPDIKSPVTCEVKIWDKKSESKIETSAQVNLE